MSLSKKIGDFFENTFIGFLMMWILPWVAIFLFVIIFGGK